MSGSVTSPTGSVGGKSLSGLVDALTYPLAGSTQPVGTTEAQWQSGTVLTDKTGICSRLVNGMQTYLANELTLRIVTTGWADLPASAPWVPPAADLPLVLPVVDPSPDGTVSSDGVHRLLRVYFMQAGKNGRAGNDTLATGGTVTFTLVDDSAPDARVEGSYDVTFGSSQVTGSFVAPVC